MKLLDILILVPLLWGAVNGYKKGLLIEIIGIGAFITAIVLGFKFLGLGMELLEPHTSARLVKRALPFLGFAVIFFPTVFLINQFGYWLRKSLKMTLLGTMDSLAGSAVGVFTWVFGVSIVFWLLTSLGIKIPAHRTDDTYLYPMIVPVAPVVVAKAVELLPASHRLIKEWKNDYLVQTHGRASPSAVRLHWAVRLYRRRIPQNNMTAPKRDIRKLPADQLKTWLSDNGEKGFRAAQIEEWLWKKSARSFAEMTNLSLKTRNMLEENYSIYAIETANTQKSSDGTVKSAFRLSDGNVVEGVLIPAQGRMTACVSSQVGCSLSCKFCATGYMERMRNLDPAEIYDQVVEISRQAELLYQVPLSNIVYMGMGEPLLNYANVMKSIELITSPDGLGMSPKRITVSTAGIAKMIRRLADDEVRFRLALSLHAANDEKRSTIMPINETNTLENLAEALNYFHTKTGNRITFEYIIFDKFNDSLTDAAELLEFTRKVPARVNIIEYNPIREADFLNAKEDRISNFARFLEQRGVVVNVRRSRGKDIDAACGQLANKS